MRLDGSTSTALPGVLDEREKHHSIRKIDPKTLISDSSELSAHGTRRQPEPAALRLAGLLGGAVVGAVYPSRREQAVAHDPRAVGLEYRRRRTVASSRTRGAPSSSLRATPPMARALRFEGQGFFDGELDAWVGHHHRENGYICACQVPSRSATVTAWPNCDVMAGGEGVLQGRRRARAPPGGIAHVRGRRGVLSLGNAVQFSYHSICKSVALF
jgi:hypothetical protein